jgi:hypothetical protein
MIAVKIEQLRATMTRKQIQLPQTAHSGDFAEQE